MDTMPDDLTWSQEWRRIVVDADGNQIDAIMSNWYESKAVTESLLNSEYPNATETGHKFIIQTRWVSEPRQA